MKRVLLVIAILTISAGCAHLPVIVPDSHSVADPVRDAVSQIYPSGAWQFSHTIRAAAPGGNTIEMVGVSVLSSTNRSIRCVLMTLEGLVLFSGRFDGNLTVERAMSPFDRPGFPEGLMSDLILLYFTPEAPVASHGRFPDGAKVIRFCSKEKTVTDLVLRKDQTWAIYEYSSGSKLVRSIEARNSTPIDGDEKGLSAKNIVLQRLGLFGYRLDMRLVEAVKLDE